MKRNKSDRLISGRKLIAVGIGQVLFAVFVLPFFDTPSRMEMLIIQVAFSIFGSTMVVLGIFIEKGLFPASLRLPTNKRKRFATTQQIFAAVIVVAAFVAVAEFLDFYIFSLPLPDRHRFLYRLNECVIIWTIIWMILGWIFYLRRNEFTFSWRTWTIILIPLIASIPDAVNELIIQCNRTYVLPAGWIRMIGFVMPLIHLLKGMMLAGLLFAQLKIWIRLTRKGFCEGCGYNLTGNVSGVCPECGKKIIRDFRVEND